jgi:hypothetical protein
VGDNKKEREEDSPEGVNNNERDALIEGGPVDAEVGAVRLRQGVESGAATTNCFVGVENAGFCGSGEDVKRICDHTFEEKEEGIHSVDGAEFVRADGLANL